MKRECNFPLVCGIGKGVCCCDCEHDCNNMCKLSPNDCGNCESDYEDEYIEPRFDVKAMFLLSKEDILIKRMYEDLKRKNPQLSDENIMEVVFNGERLLDSVMTDKYNEMLDLIEE